MQFKKKESVEGNFAKKGQDVRNGDTITLNSEGKIIEGQFGAQNIFKIQTRNGEFLMSVNQTSINALVEEFGEESSNWIGKKLNVHAIKQNVAGKFIDVYYLAPQGYEMGENGFVKVGGQPSPDEDIPALEFDEDNLPV